MKKHIKLLIVLGIVLLSGISFFLGKESKEKDIFKEESSNIKKKDTHLNSVSMINVNNLRTRNSSFFNM